MRGLAPGVKQRLRELAAANGRSLEAETRAILTAAATAPSRQTGAEPLKSIRRRIARAGGGFELPLPPRTSARRQPAR
ncbi:MAG: FitA-like ribbon-helix-helix domain-containing protein [Terriglobales bacterium]